MTEPVVPISARRGRPRSERAHQAILDAANELLEERGFVDLTIDEGAQRAGGSKPTIYRRWPTKGTLVFEAFSADFLGRQPLPGTGSFRGDLLAALRAWIKVVKGTVTGRTLASLIAEVQRDPELAEVWRERFIGPVRAQHRVMVERAMDRGEGSDDVAPDVVLDLLYGAAYHRLLQSHLPLTDRFAQAVVDTLLAGVQTNAPRQTGRASSRGGGPKRRLGRLSEHHRRVAALRHCRDSVRSVLWLRDDGAPLTSSSSASSTRVSHACSASPGKRTSTSPTHCPGPPFATSWS